MAKRRRRVVLAGLPTTLAAAALVLASQAPGIAAGGLLHPHRQISTTPAAEHCREETFNGDGVRLTGWRCATTLRRRGTVVYLHGIADNRGSSTGAIRRLLPNGFDVIAYDSRAHGNSDGTSCTYGYYEKRDLSRVLDTLPAGPVVLVGSSLGGAVALQAAATDSRVTGVIAAETFSDLATIARERAPSFLPEFAIRRAFRIAEEQGQFSVDAVAPATDARHIRVPVLLLHGADDTETLASHSQRVFANLPGRKRLILVPGAHHNQSLTEKTWREVMEWIDSVIPRRQGAGPAYS